MEPQNPTPTSTETQSVNETTTNTETKTEESKSTIKAGDLVSGVITKRVHQMAFVALDDGTEAYINVDQLHNDKGEVDVTLGRKIEAKVKNVTSGVELSREYLLKKRALDKLEAIFNEQKTVQGKITATNKGGYEVRVGNLNAFCPRSQFSLRIERAPQQQIGRVLDFVISEFKREKKYRIVLSRRPILEAAERQKAQLMGETFSVGDTIQGKTTQLSKHGVFVDVGHGIEGLIPMGELSYSHVNRASDVVKAGETIDVKVINVDVERNRLSLSIKQLTADPWVTFVEANPAGSRVNGKVTRITEFGAFVKLSQNVEGLLHISEIISKGRLNSVSERLTEGQDFEVVIKEVVKHKRYDQRKIRLMSVEVAESRKPIDMKISIDDVLTAPVKEVGERGVTLSLAPNLDGFIPSAETGTDRGANLQERFPVGQAVQAKVLTVDLKRAKVKLSIKALANHEEQMAYKNFKNEMRTEQARMSSTFGDLLKDFL